MWIGVGLGAVPDQTVFDNITIGFACGWATRCSNHSLFTDLRDDRYWRFRTRRRLIRSKALLGLDHIRR
jgi:hypothetical protein